MAIPRAGVQQLTFGNTRLRVRSDVSVNLGGTLKTPGQGMDGHGYFTVGPREASIAALVTVSSGDDLQALEALEGQTTTLSLRDGGVIIVEGSSMTVDGEVDIGEGSATVKFVGSSLKWLKP